MIGLLVSLWLAFASRCLQLAPRPADRPVPAGAAADTLSFGEMLRRAEVLAKTELVPKALQGKPEAIVVIGVWGAEHGVPLMTAIQEVHVIENRPSPSAQLRLALIRRAGHEARFVESDSTKAVLRARRREYRNDPAAWVTVTYTIDDARKAELLDQWVERWLRAPGAKFDKKFTQKIGDDRGLIDITGAPEWVAEEVATGRVHSKDNWRKYPADMLRARAASVMSRMEFSDVLAALHADDYTAEELGLDVGQDLDEPVQDHPGEQDDDEDGEVEEAVVVEDPAPGPEVPTAPAQPPAPDEAPAGEPEPPAAPLPALKAGEREDIAALKTRIRTGITPKGWAGLIPWLDACGIPITLDGITRARVGAIDAELDKRGVEKISGQDDVPPAPPMPTATGE